MSGDSFCVHNVYLDIFSTLYEIYLSLKPLELQRVGFVVRAFNVEVSSVRDQISGKHAGMGRMVFWRELLSTIYNGNSRSVPNHPVAQELNAAISQVCFVF